MGRLEGDMERRLATASALRSRASFFWMSSEERRRGRTGAVSAGGASSLTIARRSFGAVSRVQRLMGDEGISSLLTRS